MDLLSGYSSDDLRHPMSCREVRVDDHAVTPVEVVNLNWECPECNFPNFAGELECYVCYSRRNNYEWHKRQKLIGTPSGSGEDEAKAKAASQARAEADAATANPGGQMKAAAQTTTNSSNATSQMDESFNFYDDKEGAALPLPSIDPPRGAATSLKHAPSAPQENPGKPTKHSPTNDVYLNIKKDPRYKAIMFAQFKEMGRGANVDESVANEVLKQLKKGEGRIFKLNKSKGNRAFEEAGDDAALKTIRWHFRNRKASYHEWGGDVPPAPADNVPLAGELVDVDASRPGRKRQTPKSFMKAQGQDVRARKEMARQRAAKSSKNKKGNRVASKISLVEAEPCEDLGAGWTKKVVYRTRPSGILTKDTYYYSPEGKQYSSMVQVKRYLIEESAKDGKKRKASVMKGQNGVKETAKYHSSPPVVTDGDDTPTEEPTNEGAPSQEEKAATAPAPARPREPSSDAELLRLVDRLFLAVTDRKAVTVGDINRKVAEHYGWEAEEMKKTCRKTLKKAIKARLMALIPGEVTATGEGVGDNGEGSKKAKGTKQKKENKAEPSPPSGAGTEETNREIVDDDGVFDHDLDSKPLSLLYENIIQEKAADAAAIAHPNRRERKPRHRVQRMGEDSTSTNEGPIELISLLDDRAPLTSGGVLDVGASMPGRKRHKPQNFMEEQSLEVLARKELETQRREKGVAYAKRFTAHAFEQGCIVRGRGNWELIVKDFVAGKTSRMVEHKAPWANTQLKSPTTSRSRADALKAARSARKNVVETLSERLGLAEAEPCEKLGVGWITKVVPREKVADRAGATRQDRYYFSPEGKQFVSMPEAKRYLNEKSAKAGIKGRGKKAAPAPPSKRRKVETKPLSRSEAIKASWVRRKKELAAKEQARNARSEAMKASWERRKRELAAQEQAREQARDARRQAAKMGWLKRKGQKQQTAKDDGSQHMRLRQTRVGEGSESFNKANRLGKRKVPQQDESDLVAALRSKLEREKEKVRKAKASLAVVTDEKKALEADLEETKGDLDDEKETVKQQLLATDSWQSRFDELAARAAAGPVDGAAIAEIRGRPLAGGSSYKTADAMEDATEARQVDTIGKVKVGRISGYPIVVTQGRGEHEAILVGCDEDPEQFISLRSDQDLKIRWRIAGFYDSVPARDVRLLGAAAARV